MTGQLQVHFFGCSYTAGDELSDDKWHDILDLSQVTRKFSPRLLGGNLSQSQHQSVADHIAKHIQENSVK